MTSQGVPQPSQQGKGFTTQPHYQYSPVLLSPQPSNNLGHINRLQRVASQNTLDGGAQTTIPPSTHSQGSYSYRDYHQNQPSQTTNHLGWNQQPFTIQIQPQPGPSINYAEPLLLKRQSSHNSHSTQDQMVQSKTFLLDSFISETKQNPVQQNPPPQNNHQDNLEVQFETFGGQTRNTLAVPSNNSTPRVSSGFLLQEAHPQSLQNSPQLQTRRSYQPQGGTNPNFNVGYGAVHQPPGNPYQFSQQIQAAQPQIQTGPTKIQHNPKTPQIFESLQDSMAPYFTQ